MLLGSLLAFVTVHHRALRWWAGDLAAGEAVPAFVLALVVSGVALRRETGAPTGRASPGWALLAVVPPLVVRLSAPVAGHGSTAALAAIASAVGGMAPFLSARTRRHLWALAGLWACALPVGDMVDAMIGFTLRTWLAAGAATVLALGGEAVPVETVLRVEGGVAHVDLPCAGLDGSWALAVTVLAAHVVLDLPAGPRSVAAAVVGGATYLLGNLVRIVVVVGSHHLLGAPVLAESLHVPLGVAAFAAAVSATWALLPSSAPAAGAVPSPPGRWPLAVAAVWWVLAAVPLPEGRAEAPAPVTLAAWTPVPLTPGEVAFSRRQGAAIRKGTVLDGAATVALVTAVDPLAHHSPERCLTATGWTLSDDVPALVGGLTVRRAVAERDGRRARAVWWFEAADRTTADLAERVRSGVLTPQTWVLVSVLVDGSVDDARTDALVARLHAELHDALPLPGDRS